MMQAVFKSKSLTAAVVLVALVFTAGCGGSSSSSSPSGSSGKIDPQIMVLQSTTLRHINNGDYAAATDYFKRLDLDAIAADNATGTGLTNGYWAVMENGEAVTPGVDLGIDTDDPFADAELAIAQQGMWVIPGTGSDSTPERAEWHTTATECARQYNEKLEDLRASRSP